MAAMSDYLESQMIALLFRSAAATKPTVLAIALCTAAPTDASNGGTITEVAGGSYARQALNPSDSNWAPPSSNDGTTNNLVAITFPTATAVWGLITHVAILDTTALGAGNIYFYGAMATSKSIGIGDTYQIAIGNLQIQMDD